MKVDHAKPLTATAIAPLRVLLLEHSATHAEKILRELQNAGFAVEPTVVSSRQDFLDKLTSSDFSVVLSAYQLPEWTGMEAFEELRRSGKEIPFILISGVLGEEAAIECVKRGVTEYVLKSHLARLPIALRRALEGKSRNPSTHELSDGVSDGHTGDHQLMIENAVYGIFRVLPPPTESCGSTAASSMSIANWAKAASFACIYRPSPRRAKPRLRNLPCHFLRRKPRTWKRFSSTKITIPFEK
jgi:CheY-like chemotaxis protein